VRRTLLRHAIAAVTALLLLAPQARAQDRVALLIGNGEYIHAGKLVTPANDANDLAAMLRGIGFDVTVATDLDRRGMDGAFRAFGDKLGAGKVALFYYSGQGLQVAGRNHMVPIDARITQPADLEQQTLGLDAVLERMAGPGRINLVFFDASRNNPFAPAGSRQPAGPSAALPRDDRAPQVLIGFAASSGQTISEATGRNSPYATALLAHLGTPGVPIAEVLRRLRGDVARATGGRQVPAMYDSLLDTFVLVPAAAR
jgi:uncharacterized caspase-like protein